MKLYPFETRSRLATNISKYSRKLKMKVITLEPARLEGLIIIGNGSPEDVVVSIIAHHLNENSLMGIVKPKRTGLGIFELLSTYLRLKVDKIVILLDQDDIPLDSLLNHCEKKLNSFAIHTDIDERSEERLRIYRCNHGNRTFMVILVINGLNEISVAKHTVEDHLLKLASEMCLIDKVNEGLESSKEIWKTLEHRYQEEVFKKIKERRVMAEDVFPQQYMGCKYLKEL